MTDHVFPTCCNLEYKRFQNGTDIGGCDILYLSTRYRMTDRRSVEVAVTEGCDLRQVLHRGMCDFSGDSDSNTSEEHTGSDLDLSSINGYPDIKRASNRQLPKMGNAVALEWYARLRNWNII